MSLLEQIEKSVTDAKAKIAAASAGERDCIAKINVLGPKESPRGSKCPISGEIKTLDEKRREFAAKRREAQRELALASGLLQKARGIVSPKKPGKRHSGEAN